MTPREPDRGGVTPGEVDPAARAALAGWFAEADWDHSLCSDDYIKRVTETNAERVLAWLAAEGYSVVKLAETGPWEFPGEPLYRRVKGETT